MDHTVRGVRRAAGCASGGRAPRRRCLAWARGGQTRKRPRQISCGRPSSTPWARRSRRARPSPSRGISSRRRSPRRKRGSHNNFYEFLLGEGGFVCPLTNDFEVEPWAVEVSGECNKPTTFDLDAINAIGLEERLYAFRCVERWVMNVPWVGVPLAKLLERAEPTSDAKFVRFVSAAHR